MDTYPLVLKDGKPSPFLVQRKPGMLRDQATLLFKDKEITTWTAGSLRLTGSESFKYQDKMLTLRWQWNEVTGKPKTIQIFNQDKLLATYPPHADPIQPRKKWHYATIGFSLASLMSGGLFIGLSQGSNLQNNLGLALLIFVVCTVLFTGVGVALDLLRRK